MLWRNFTGPRLYIAAPMDRLDLVVGPHGAGKSTFVELTRSHRCYREASSSTPTRSPPTRPHMRPPGRRVTAETTTRLGPASLVLLDVSTGPARVASANDRRG